MKIEKIPTDKLIPYARNAKRHDAAQVSKLAGSIKEFGFNNPVLIDKDNGIIAGHGRVMAAQQLGLAEVPCIRLGHLTDNQRRAYILADNRLAEINSGWDEELLKLEVSDIDWGDIKGLSVDDFEFGEIEFGEEEKEGEKSDADAEPQIDKAEELRAKWGVEPGQLWELGDHRLLCGDSTIHEHVAKLMQGEKAQTFFTDPPYGDNVGGLKPKTGAEKIKGKGLVKRASFIENDKEIDWLRTAFDLVVDFLSEDSTKMVFFKWDRFAQILQMASAFGEPSALCVWNRVKKASAFFRFQPQHELCFHWGNQADKKESMDLSNVWSEPKESENKELHPTVKPLSILEPAIRVTTEKGKIVLDLFCGSGSMLIACENSHRKCRAIEISPAYVAVALQRWADATGKTPRKL